MSVVSYDTKPDANPAPRDGIVPDAGRISWLDIATAIENEAGRNRISRDENMRRLAALGDAATPLDREMYRGIIASCNRNAAIFDAVSRLVENVRSDDEILRRLDAKARGESPDAVEPSDWRYE